MVCPSSSISPGDCCSDLLQLSQAARREGWWAVTDSNRRHSACKADALPTELTALRGDLSPYDSTAQGQHPMPSIRCPIATQHMKVVGICRASVARLRFYDIVVAAGSPHEG